MSETETLLKLSLVQLELQRMRRMLNAIETLIVDVACQMQTRDSRKVEEKVVCLQR